MFNSPGKTVAFDRIDDGLAYCSIIQNLPFESDNFPCVQTMRMTIMNVDDDSDDDDDC